MIQLFRLDTYSVILNLAYHVLAAALEVDIDCLVFAGKFDRIGEEIGDYLLYLFFITVDYIVGGAVEVKFLTFFLLHNLICVEYAAHSLSDVEIASVKDHLA